MVSDRPRQPKLDWVLRVKRELDVDGMNHLVNNLFGVTWFRTRTASKVFLSAATRQKNHLVNNLIGGDMVSTRVSKFEVHAERVVTLVKQSL